MKQNLFKSLILVQTNYFQVPPGLAFGPDLPPLKFKEVKTARKKVKSKSAMERARKAQRLERQKERKARLQERAKRREEEKQRRAERGETLVTKAKSKQEPKSHHGTESVDTTILKLLGKSRKSKKVAAKSKKDLGEKKKVETVDAKWKPGMRREAREGWQEERKLREKAEAERCSKKETTRGSTMPKTSDSKSFIEDILSDLVANLPVSGEKKVLHWSPNRRDDEATVRGEDGMVLDDVGSDLEADRHWDPHTAAGSHSDEAGAEADTEIEEENQVSPGLTSSSEEEGGEADFTRSKRKKIVKRARAKTPTLTSDSEEEKPDNEKLMEMEPVKAIGTDDLQGGGAGGSNHQIWLRLAMRIMEGVRRAELPLTLPLDDITEGDGNCYFRALWSQLQRPEVAAPEEIRQLDHRSLRKAICDFMLKSRLPVVEEFKQRWFEFYLGNYDQYWRGMAESRGDIWAEGPVIHASAWRLERDIYVVSEKATVSDPFLPFSGNQDGTDKACAGAALWLGHLTGLHYQTLMPTQSESMPPRPNLRKVEDTLQAKAQATVNGGDQQSCQPGVSKTSGVGKVSLIHSQ